MFAERPVVTGTQSPQRNEFHVIADHPGNGTGGTAGADPGGGCPEQCGSFCTDTRCGHLSSRCRGSRR